ncbi:CGNR zinc finger domain-containing protein [Acinetobacter pittii]|uniref:CGNR zinc finger domain-containing protein n=1 Tax=Acinetobacter pittii TaxID=48296 RepID=UPI003260CA1F
MTNSNDFRFDLGSLSLNFIATVGSRNSLHPIERVSSPILFKQWLIKSSLIDDNDNQLTVTQSDLEQAIILRETLHRFIHDFVHQKKINDQDLQVINHFASYANTHFPQLCKDINNNLYIEPSKIPSVNEILGSIAVDIIQLVTGEEKMLLRECGGFSCDGIYVDRSRGFRRLWCSSKTCGNAERVDRHRTKYRTKSTS